MSNLIPERRPDKNGVVSTKWVRPAALCNATGDKIPAPELSPASREDWGSLVGSQIEAIAKDSRMGGVPGNPLSQFDYEAVVMVNEMLERNIYLESELLRVFNQAYRWTHEDKDESPEDPFLPMKDLAVFGEIIMNPDAVANDAEPIIRGLAEHFGEERDYLHGVTEEERRSALALVTVITLLENPHFIKIYDQYDEGPGGDYRFFGLKSSELAELVKAHPDDAQQIVQIVNERDDASMVAEILKSEHKALGGGIL